MKTISIVNLKGGVGKTVTAVNLAAILATEYAQRVLLIDADHQGNSSKFYRIPAEPGSLADLFEGTVMCYTDLVQPTIYRGLDVIPADMSLAALELDGQLPEDVHGGLPRDRALRALTDLRGMAIGAELLELCSEVRVYGDRISEGMQAEIRQAEALGIPVRYVRGDRA